MEGGINIASFTAKHLPIMSCGSVFDCVPDVSCYCSWVGFWLLWFAQVSQEFLLFLLVVFYVALMCGFAILLSCVGLPGGGETIRGVSWCDSN